MAKRKMQRSDLRAYGSDDNPIGLTGAFEIIRDPQAVEYDEGDRSIGLTEAFGAVSGEDDFVHSWDEAGKWTDFDWDSHYADAPAEDGRPDAAHDAAAASQADGEEAGAGTAAGPEGAPAAAEGSPTPDLADGGPAGGSDGAAGPSSGQEAGSAAASAAAGGKRGKRGRHAAPEPELSPRMKKSKRTRRVLIVIVVLLICVLGALGYFILKTFSESQQEAAQQAQQQVAAPKEDIAETSGDDAVETAAKATDVPKLTPLLGKTADEAVAELGRGALITQNREVKEKGSAIKTSINVALTEEPADSKTGTPTVYLGLDKKGKIIQVGYSASASALGFGQLSFSDAVNQEHVIEKTLAKIGVDVDEGAAALPKDKSKYSTYASDGATVTKERCSFKGSTTVDGDPCEWSAVLSYDYTTQVVTGNLSDTVRIIYVYVTKK